MIGAALCARGGRGGEREPLSTPAFDQHLFGTPLVDLAELNVLNFIARLGALGYLSQLSISPFPFPRPRTGITRHDYKGSAVTFTCLVIPSVLEHEKNLMPVHKWGKGKEE